ncbi:TetR-like C-terminal domain-containing protein [Nocardiopsis suaedae]|uniref:TetR-like C-terminal domain-containing protein n=1 Tax=Nocardiopsis suaedae TaxID=3018444 RepID=A0ABT4TSU3_9ACTN|nr:TetR-like C-terminal domain-containing protein [Nocardiopsis suaedae]MDA2807760.1 TetR-like C-terminal domain-containing protein [Nocardiopsis suaedae]
MPRAGLSPAAVAEAAAAVADAEGLGALSLKAVAHRLGVASPSLYKHVAGLDGLRREVAMLAAREFGEVLGSAAMGRSGPDALRAVAAAYREFARTRPGRYAALNTAPPPEDTEVAAAFWRPVEVLAAVLRGFGIAERDLVDEIRAVRSSLHGFADLEATGGFGLPEDVDRSFDRMVERSIAGLRARTAAPR